MNIIKRNGTFWKEIPFNVENAEAIRTKAKHGIVMCRDTEARLLATDINNHGYPIAAVINTAGEERVVDVTCYGNIFSANLCLQLLVPTKFKTYENFTPCKFQACLVKTKDSDIWHIDVCSGYTNKGNPTFLTHQACDYLPLCEATLPLYSTSKSWKEYIKELNAKEYIAANTHQPDTNVIKKQ